jgi:Tfp pilus assembly protein PilX
MTRSINRSSEQGIALILALFMVVVLSTLSVSLMFVSQTETWSTQNYKMMSQARYGAESGIHKIANHLMFTYVPPAAAGADPIANYNINVSPVTAIANGQPVVLSADAAIASNYPIAAVQTAFNAAGQGTLTGNDAKVGYTAVARLIRMRPITSAYTGTPVTLQTWEITATGTISGSRSGSTEVSTILERPTVPAFSYAAFATNDGCGALSFAGGATTDSYDSATFGGGTPVPDLWGGNVGTNGNLDENGNPTEVYGSLSTPRSGVGACSVGNVTGLSGNEHVTSGVVPLSQPIQLPTPDPPSPLPPTTPTDFSKTGGCPAGVTSCVVSTDGATIHPPSASSTITMGDVSIGSHGIIHFGAGTYIINSLTMNANSQIVVDSGPVIFQVAGVGQATPITITGQGISNTSYNPQNLQFVYGGTGEVKMAGGAETSALLYAPNATGSFTGGSDWYGAVVVGRLTEAGGASIHYDRRLARSAVVAGNEILNSFTWKKY